MNPVAKRLNSSNATKPPSQPAGAASIMSSDSGTRCRNAADINMPAAKFMKCGVFRCPQPANRRMVKIPAVVTSAADALVPSAAQKALSIVCVLPPPKHGQEAGTLPLVQPLLFFGHEPLTSDAMPADRYQEKRDFRRTPEPRGEGAHDQRDEQPVFVIQQHDASTMHFDFRLEVEGVLRSWAVPKGPSTDSSQKRLAIPTEDHPLKYADFEGVIPEGEYGAGAVLIWDRGAYQNLSQKDGEVLVRAAVP